MRVSVFTLHSAYFAWYPSLEGCVNNRNELWFTSDTTTYESEILEQRREANRIGRRILGGAVPAGLAGRRGARGGYDHECGGYIGAAVGAGGAKYTRACEGRGDHGGDELVRQIFYGGCERRGVRG